MHMILSLFIDSIGHHFLLVKMVCLSQGRDIVYSLHGHQTNFFVTRVTYKPYIINKCRRILDL